MTHNLVNPMHWTLEVVLVPVTDIERAIRFYRDVIGFTLDHETALDGMHFAQLTPRGSGCSIVVGNLEAHRQMAAGSLRGLQLVVSDASRARSELMERGAEVSELSVFDARDGGTTFSFSDPDGNTWTVQQIKARAERPLIPRSDSDLAGF